MNLWTCLVCKSVFKAGKGKACGIHRAGTRGLRSTYPPASDPWQDDDKSGQHGEEDGDDDGPGSVKGEARIGSGVEGEGAVPQRHPAALDGWKSAPRETSGRKITFTLPPHPAFSAGSSPAQLPACCLSWAWPRVHLQCPCTLQSHVRVYTQASPTRALHLPRVHPRAKQIWSLRAICCNAPACSSCACGAW